MKIGGVEVTKCEELLVLPRGGKGKDIPFRAHPVVINDDFNKLCPEPVAPMMMTKDGNKPDLGSENYKSAVRQRDSQRFAYLCIRSLEPSNIEWSEVDLEKPSTWLKWTEELESAGLSDVEIQRVIQTVLVANSLDEEKVNEARKTFLRGLEG